MKLGTRLFVGGLALTLAVTAFAPLIGVNALIYNMSLTDEPVATNFLVIRSATFATLSFFSVNLLRRKRPLSSVAPMLVFCNFTVLFGSGMMIQRSQYDFVPWLALAMIAGVAYFLFQENRAETSVIFRDSW